jgi:hypothetical protein
MRVARPVVLRSDQQEILESRARARSAPACGSIILTTARPGISPSTRGYRAA